MKAQGGKRGALTTKAASALVVLVLVTVAACGGEEQPAGGGGGSQSEPVKVELPGSLAYELMLPSMVAAANGYYEDNGIDIDIIPSSGSDSRQALMAGQYDFALLATVHVPIARLGGAPLRSIASMHDLEIFSLVARTELEGEVDSVEDLAGRKVGYSDPGSGSWYIGSLFLQKAGIDPEQDIDYISLGADPGVILTSLESGKVDAFPSWEPMTTRAIEEGLVFPIVPVWEPDVHAEWIGDKALSMVLTTRDDVIESKPELVEDMVDATLKGLADVRDGSAEELADLVMANDKTSDLFEGMDRELVVAIFDKILAGFGDGCLSPGGYQTELDILLDLKVIEESVPFEEFADTTWAGECSE